MHGQASSSQILTSKTSVLADSQGVLLVSRAVILVSMDRPRQFQTALATHSVSPIAAMYLPAGVRVRGADEDALTGSNALWFVGEDQIFHSPRRELLPSRMSIELDDFAALLHVFHAEGMGGEDGVIRWLRREGAKRLLKRNGQRQSVAAWKKWSRLAADTEFALATSRLESTLDAAVEASSERERQAVARLLGLALPRAAAELRRRRLLLLAVLHGRVDNDLVWQAGFASMRQCHKDFERACGESAGDWLSRNGLLPRDPVGTRGEGGVERAAGSAPAPDRLQGDGHIPVTAI